MDALPDLLDRVEVERVLDAWPALPVREQVAWDAPLMLAYSLAVLAEPAGAEPAWASP